METDGDDEATKVAGSIAGKRAAQDEAVQAFVLQVLGSLLTLPGAVGKAKDLLSKTSTAASSVKLGEANVGAAADKKAAAAATGAAKAAADANGQPCG